MVNILVDAIIVGNKVLVSTKLLYLLIVKIRILHKLYGMLDKLKEVNGFFKEKIIIILQDVIIVFQVVPINLYLLILKIQTKIQKPNGHLFG
jgi:hypothetical protein